MRSLWRCIFLLFVQVEHREKEKENVVVSGVIIVLGGVIIVLVENKHVDYVRSIFNGCVREHGIFWIKTI